MIAELHVPVSFRTKYLYLLYDDSFLHNRNYIFTTKGHPLPVMPSLHHDVKRKEGNEHTYFCSAPTDFNTFASILKVLFSHANNFAFDYSS